MDFLVPVSDDIKELAAKLNPQTIGSEMTFFDPDDNLDLEGFDIALVGVNESRLCLHDSVSQDFSQLRKEFYQLYKGEWKVKLLDLGNVEAGETVADTHFAVKTLSRKLMEYNMVPIFMGGGQDMMLPLYRSMDDLYHMVNVVNIDSHFDLGEVDADLDHTNYVGKMVVQKPYNLFNYMVLGYQTYFQSADEIALFDNMFFDAVRLGEIGENPVKAEPYLRDADIVGIDIRSIAGSASGRVNGLSGREVCALARYAGISDRVKLFGIFELTRDFILPYDLLAQMLWYFVEGYVLRNDEYPVNIDDSYTRYTVTLENTDVVFYKSGLSKRWWMEMPFSTLVDNKPVQHTLLSCTEMEYEEACNGNLPERWLKAQLKNSV